MEPVEIEIEETVEAEADCGECICKPYAVIRYRNPIHEPELILGAASYNYWGNDDWVVLIDEAGDEVLAARSSEVLSVELIK